MALARPSLLWPWLLGALLLGPLAERSAAAAPWRLDWRAPASCPSGEEIQRDIERRVGSSRGPLEVTATVSRGAEGYHVELRLDGEAEGVRELDATTCESLARAVTLIVVLALDPNAATALAEELDSAQEARQEPPAERAERAPPKQESKPDEARPAEPQPRVALSAGLLVETAWVPGVALGAVGEADWLTRHFQLGLLGGGVPGTSVTSSSGPASELGWSFVGVRACAGWTGPLELWLCARGRGAWLSVTGRGADQVQTATSFEVLVEPGAVARLPVAAGFGVQLGGFLTLPTRSTHFVFDDETTNPPTQTEVFRLGPGASLFVALDYRFLR